MMEIKHFSKELIMWGVNNQVQDIYVFTLKNSVQIFARARDKRFLFKELSISEGEKLIFHFKFIGSMDVGEKRKVQAGSVTYQLTDSTIRLRLSTLGDFRQRESLVIRFLYMFKKPIKNYLLPNQKLSIYNNLKRRGLHLFCGPVGSGKTTLMYSFAKEQIETQQIISIEDPVEIEEESFLQLQTNTKIGLTYDLLIKACLRHRPDILIIGEIRDSETAKAAIRASLTGHIVFATLHARSTSGVYERLMDLGIPEKDISECVSSVIYQRILTNCQPNIFYDKGLLMDCDFDQSRVSKWIKQLRKVWAYGFISNQVFEEAKNM